MILWFFLTAIVVVFPATSTVTQSDEASGSGVYISTTIEPESTSPPPTATDEERGDEDDDGICVVPPYVESVAYTTNTTQEGFERLIDEARCFLECADELELFDVDYTGLPAWPYLIVAHNCGRARKLHECTRGCVTQREHRLREGMNLDSGDCRNECGERCKSECGCPREEKINNCHCSENVHNDPWLPQIRGCRVECIRKQCETGCGITISNYSGIETNTTIPPAPVSAPVLRRSSSEPNSFEAGKYTIDFTSSVPNATASTSDKTVTFVLKIEDLLSGNVSYIFQHGPAGNTSLAGYTCRDVNVSFAVANKFGYSEFSPETSISVYGDSRHIPNAVVNVTVSEVIDTRPGFFGHALVTLTWEKHENGLHVMYFLVEVAAGSGTATLCGNNSISQKVNSTESDSTYSLFIEAEKPSDIPFMGCTYYFTIHAVGENGSTSVTKSTLLRKFVPSIEFQCSRIWDSIEYFSFNLTWIMPPYLVHKHVMDELFIRQCLVDENGEDVHGASLPGTKILSIDSGMINQTILSKTLSEHHPYYRPHSEPAQFYKFKMHINWIGNLTYRPAEHTYTCFISTTSPAPSSVQELVIDGYSISADFKVSLNLSWLPPAVPNGMLNYYDVCIGRQPLPLDFQGEPTAPYSCRATPGADTTSLFGFDLHYFPGSSPCLYVQMRAHNMYVSGNWSDPALLTTDYSESCEEVTDGIETTSAPLTMRASTTLRSNDSTTVSSSTVLNSTVSQSSSKVDAGVIAPVVASLAIFAILLCVIIALVVAYIRMIRRRKRLWRISQEPCDDPMFISGIRNPMLRSPTDPAQSPMSPMTDEWEIPPSEVIMEAMLGEGAFGLVYKGILKGPITSSTVKPWMRNAIGTPVAIKLLKESAKGSERQDFLSEIEMMKRVAEGQNTNVVCLLACVTIQEPLCLITEFVKYGDLLSYLRNNRQLYAGNRLEGEDDPYLELGTISSIDLISFAYQIASGMEFLSSLGIVHRDLACRNVLVDDGKVLKITDFGMSRTTETNEIYVQKSKGRVPLKWMAIESIIAREFTTYSDVWSYGITLWEISTLGGFPYPTVSNEELLLLLKQGHRMEKPDNCSPEVYDVMLGCWHEDPKKRPSFTELRAKFDNMLVAEREDAYIDLQIDTEKPYYQMDFKMELNENESQASTGMDLLQATPVLKRLSQVSCGGASNLTTPFLASELSPSPARRSHISSAASSPGRSHRSMHSASPCKETDGRSRRNELVPNGNVQGNGDLRRPVSLMLPGRERRENDSESRYVAEPSRLVAAAVTLGLTVPNDNSLSATRSGSDGALTLNLNGVASNHEVNGGLNLQNPEITVTEEAL